VRVTSITGNSQAEALGLQRGDLITEYNGQVAAGMEVLRAAVKRTTESDNVSMIVVRGGATLVHSLKGGLIGITGEDHRR
jgi:S1-C subfamily serine protease